MLKVRKKTAVVGLLLFAGALTSLGREVVFGYLYGLSEVLDAYRVSVSLPQTVGMLLPSVFVATLIPVLQKIRIENPEHEEIFLRKFFRQSAIGGVVVSFGLCLFSSVWISFLAPGFSPSVRDSSAEQLLYLSWYFLLLVLIGGYKAVLDSREIFWPGAAANLFLHGIIVVVLPVAALFGFVQRFPNGTLVVSTLLGGLILFLVQLLVAGPLRGTRLSSEQTLPAELLTEYAVPWKGMGILFLYHGIGQAARFVDRGMASQFGNNAVSIVEYAFNIISFPSFILITSIITVFYPEFTKMLALGDTEGARGQVVRLSSSIFLVSFFSCIFIWLFGFEIIQFFFARGAFTSDAAIRVFDFINYQLYGVPFMVTGLLFAQILAAYGKYRLLLVLGVGKLVVKLVSALVFVKFIGWNGLPLSFSITAIIGTILSGYIIYRIQIGRSF